MFGPRLTEAENVCPINAKSVKGGSCLQCSRSKLSLHCAENTRYNRPTMLLWSGGMTVVVVKFEL